jgi:hypothetical protein
VVRRHSHDERLYSLGLGEAKGQSATDNRVFGWHMFGIPRSNNSVNVDGVSFRITRSLAQTVSS